MKRGGTTRGRVVEELNARFFARLDRPDGDAVAAYEDYLDARDASYMHLETLETQSGAVPSPFRRAVRSATSDLAGYDRIALAVVRAIHFDQSRIIPLNVRNAGAIAELRDDDVVEVPCVVNNEGARPDARRVAPDAVRDLLLRVKEYERLTVRAALSGDRDDARCALGANPLVPNAVVAEALLEGLQWQA
jgi:6-phospho-beta-glucosidase